jgi:CRISPR/Cas system-associated exonuclease Cas4 (RecB family)
MSLSTFIKTLRRDKILLPILKKHLAKENRLIEEGKMESKQIVMDDADMTIKCFQERKVEYNHRQKLEGDFFHPSQLGQCLRKMYFAHKNAPTDGMVSQEDGLRTALVFELGTYIHVIVQNLCERAGVLLSREVAIIDKKNRHLGHADGILLIDGEKYLLEIKSINSRGFAALTAPKEEHKMQVHAYMKSLGLKWTIFVYLDKDTSKLKEFVVPYNERYYLKTVFSRIDLFFSSLHGGVLPPREGESPTRMPCAYCQFKRLCFDEATLKQWLSNEIKGKEKRKAVSGKPVKKLRPNRRLFRKI